MTGPRVPCAGCAIKRLVSQYTFVTALSNVPSTFPFHATLLVPVQCKSMLWDVDYLPAAA